MPGTLFSGAVRNTTDLQFRTFRDTTDGLELIRGSKSVSGTGNGGSYQIQTMKKRWSAMHLSFVFLMYKIDRRVVQPIPDTVSAASFGTVWPDVYDAILRRYTTIPSRFIILSMLERHSLIRKLMASSSGMERYSSGRIGFVKMTFTFL